MPQGISAVRQTNGLYLYLSLCVKFPAQLCHLDRTNVYHAIAHDTSRWTLVAEARTYSQAFHVEFMADKLAVAQGLLRSVFPCSFDIIPQTIYIHSLSDHRPYTMSTATVMLVKTHVKSDFVFNL